MSAHPFAQPTARHRLRRWTTAACLLILPAASLPASQAALRGAPDEGAPAPADAPAEDVGNIRPEALPPENVRWRAPDDRTRQRPPPGDSAESIVVEPTRDDTRARPSQPGPQPGTPTRILTGTLVRKITARGPQYPLRLRGDRGRLAYVDMSRLYIGDLRPYLDRKVRISGELRPLASGGSELVLHARTIRIVD